MRRSASGARDSPSHRTGASGKVTASEDVLRPERDWEGAKLPITASKAGAVKGRQHALRDPGIFVDTDGRRYLLYSVAGESGLAIAELK